MQIEKGDRIKIYGDKVKVVFDIHTNGNPVIKNQGTLCQVPLEQCEKLC